MKWDNLKLRVILGGALATDANSILVHAGKLNQQVHTHLCVFAPMNFVSYKLESWNSVTSC